MKTSFRIASVVGATAALSLLAAPAFAVGPQMVATAGTTVSAKAVTRAIKITPVHLTLRQYQRTGLVAHLSGYPASTVLNVGYGFGQGGDDIGTFTTDAEGAAIVHFKPTDHLVAQTFTFGTNYTVPSDPSTPAGGPTTTKTTTSPTGDTITATTTDWTTPSDVAGEPGHTVKIYNVTYTVKPSNGKVAWGTAHRSGTKVALKATVTRWSPTAKKYVPWHSATVKFQERIAGVWKTKTTVTTNRKGVAAKTVSAKVHTWRALVLSTKSIWGTASKSHKK